MPSTYRHQEHAGNFADVHKHWLLGLLLEQLLADPQPLHYLESHAGAGAYRANHGAVNSAASGIARLWRQPMTAPSVVRYQERVTVLNPDGRLNTYPGSPLLAAQYLRREDRGTLVERDEVVFTQLACSLAGDTRFCLQQGDGPALIDERLPQKGRWLLLVDPPFLDPAEFSQIATWISELLRRDADGTLALWYPLTTSGQQRGLLERLSHAIDAPHITSEFRLRGQKRGMYGSGMRLLNPPPTMMEPLQRDGPELAAALGCKERVGSEGDRLKD